MRYRNSTSGVDRRSYLGAVAGVSTAMLGGCTGFLSSESSPYAEVLQWTIPPRSPDESLTGYTIEAGSPASLLSNEHMSSGLAERLTLQPSIASRAIGGTSIDLTIGVVPHDAAVVGGYSVHQGSFERSDLLEFLEDEGGERVHSYEGFAVVDLDGHVVGIGDGTVIELGLTWTDDRPEDLEHVVDASMGRRDQIDEWHDGVATVADRLDVGDFSELRIENGHETESSRGLFDNVLASGRVGSVDGAETTLNVVLAYNRERDVDRDSLDEVLDEAESMAGVEEATYTIDGRVVEFTAIGATGELI